MSDLPQIAPDLTEQQHAAIRARVHELLDWTAVAATVGVDRSTVYGWRQIPAFRDALEAEVVRLDKESRERRRAAERVAWDALLDVAKDRTHRDRVKAADSILDRIGQVRGASLTVDGTVGVAALSPEELAARRQVVVERLVHALEAREE